MQHFKKSDLMPVSEPASKQVALLQDLPDSPRREPSGLATSELLRLQHAVSKRHNDWAEVTQFVSTAEGDGCGQVAYDLGWISAAWLGKRVLFIDGTAGQARRNAFGVTRPRHRLRERVLQAGERRGEEVLAEQ